MQLHSQLKHAEEDNFQLEKQNKQLATKHNDIKSRVSSVMSENEDLKIQVSPYKTIGALKCVF